MSKTNNSENLTPQTITPHWNPVHYFLYSIPKGFHNVGPISLPTKTLPQWQKVTGDQEIDLILWLNEICQTTNDMEDLDKVLEYSKQITTPAEELAARYKDFKLRNGDSALVAALGTYGFADLNRKVESARYRINKTLEGLKIFGSYKIAMAPSVPEVSMMEKITLSEDELFDLSYEDIPTIFVDTVNPGTLSQVLEEIRYWEWLNMIRKPLAATFDLKHIGHYRETLLEYRNSYLYRLLYKIDPVDQEEARKVARALLPDDLCLDDGTMNKILLHLLGVHYP